MSRTADVIVIGAGVAGLGVAAALAGRADVIVLEAEAAPCTQTSGRSAAMFLTTYGPEHVRALSVESEPFYEAPPEGFADGPLLAPRGELFIDDGDGSDAGAMLAANPDYREITAAEAVALIPILNPEGIARVAYDPTGRDIDIDRLTGGYRRMLTRPVVCNARVTGLTHKGGVWRAETTAGAYEAPVVVNAAGAWASPVAEMAGAASIRITPKRRSAAIVTPPAGLDPRGWPMFLDAKERFYARPMGGALMVSPAEEIPVPPHDIVIDRYDEVLAGGVDRFQARVNFEVTRLDSPWAGLRSFSDDGEPVVGHDPEAEGFFWLAGQGGYGFQTAPALSARAADMILGQGRRDATETALSPARYA